MVEFGKVLICFFLLVGGGRVRVGIPFGRLTGHGFLYTCLRSKTEIAPVVLSIFLNKTLILSMVSLRCSSGEELFTVLAAICRQQIRAVINFCVH